MKNTRFTLFIISFFLLTYTIQSQHLWYENETFTENILFTKGELGTFLQKKINPDKNGNNPNTESSKFIRNASVNRGFVYFDLQQPIEVATRYTVSLKAYLDISKKELSTSPKRLRVYLKNTTTGTIKYKQTSFSSAQEWENFSFVFQASDFTSDGLKNGGYNLMYIGFGNGTFSNTKTSYYIDQIYGTTKQTPINKTAKSLQGSWGARLYVRGGEDLDTYVGSNSNGGKEYDYVAGAQEIVDNYTTMDYVITNATNNANSQLWTLRNNENVDAVMGFKNSIVNEEFVPSLANEQVIIDVINVFKKSNKKVFLYLNSMSPATRATPKGAEAWNNYVDTYFKGNEHLAWMDYCEGYIKRFKELEVDGYWIDAYRSYPGNDTERAEFVQMIRNVDPNISITTNYDKDYFIDENGENILVDTDGVEDINETDYRIVKMTATENWSDFTAGHITPLGQGAPPNSWAYEEFTLNDFQASPLSSYDGSKLAVKHIFLPIRSSWSSERSDLMFDGDQAYRFVKKITDAGGMVTFSTTTNTDGTTMEDEESVLKYVDQRFAANAAASKYVRPLGAFLVGEEQLYPWYENENDTPTDYISIENTLHGTTTQNFSNPFKREINTSTTITKMTRNGGKTARIYFNLPKPITNLSTFKVSLNAFINKKTPSNVDARIRVYLLNTTSNTIIYKQLSLSAGRTWDHLEFDFSELTPPINEYDQMAIGFANGDSSNSKTKYYIDNIKGSINQYVNANDNTTRTIEEHPIISDDVTFTKDAYIEENNSVLKLSPNPVYNYFKLSEQVKSVLIYTITGRKMLEFTNYQNSYDISKLNSGLYIIRTLDNNGKSKTVRFLKN